MAGYPCCCDNTSLRTCQAFSTYKFGRDATIEVAFTDVGNCSFWAVGCDTLDGTYTLGWIGGGFAQCGETLVYTFPTFQTQCKTSAGGLQAGFFCVASTGAVDLSIGFRGFGGCELLWRLQFSLPIEPDFLSGLEVPPYSGPFSNCVPSGPAIFTLL